MSDTVLTKSFIQLQNEVIGFFHNRLHCVETAKDLTQEVYLRLERIERSKQIENHRSYIFATARNLLKDHVRNESRRSVLLKENSSVLWMDHQPSAEKVVEGKTEIRAIQSVINNIPLISRKIFNAHRFENKTRKEIAADNNMSLTSVENHIRLVLDCFTDVLEKTDR